MKTLNKLTIALLFLIGGGNAIANHHIGSHVQLGEGATAGPGTQGAVAVGQDAKAQGPHRIAIGVEAEGTGQHSIAIGTDVTAAANQIKVGRDDAVDVTVGGVKLKGAGNIIAELRGLVTTLTDRIAMLEAAQGITPPQQKPVNKRSDAQQVDKAILPKVLQNIGGGINKNIYERIQKRQTEDGRWK